MKKLIESVLIAITFLIFVTGCSDKAKEEAQTPPPIPVDTQIAIDTTPIVPVDTTPVQPEIPGMPKPPQGDGYAVQVASCTGEDYARYLVDLWTGRGYEPFVTDYSHNGDTYYRIRMGLFGTLGEAKSLSAELKDKYSVNAWVEQVSY